MLVVLLMLSPVLDPWYVTWIVPFLCLYRFRSLILLTGIVFIHYFRFRPGFDDAVWLQIVEFGLFYLFLIAELYVLRKHFRDHSGAERGGGPPQSAAGDPVHGS